ncbi:MAG: dTDP-4-dehydrorhamnose reductase [Acidobacteria bacterium]|nr:dTDP-4-dehydrorhamnose reductase [Acidobacteriota bacterium]
MENVLILGARGMLGGQVRALCPKAAAWDLPEVNVLDFPALTARIDALAPAAIVNCVAFNDVDGAEDRPEAAFALNAEFPGRLARLAAGRDIPLVHYSTNYVFDGVQGEYEETDPPAPLSVYGRSKRDGEEAVLAAGGRAWVVRTAVIFGPQGASELSKRSFVDLMLDLAAKRDVIQAVEDEVNSVTYAPDLARATMDLLAGAPPPGLYHLTNSGAASWCDFAREIFRAAEKSVTVIPVPSSRFPRKAARPARAVLVNTRRPALRPWQRALAELLGRPDRLS